MLPDLIRFAYIPRDQLRINSDAQGDASLKGRGGSPDFSAFALASSSSGFTQSTPHEDEHVLILDFAAPKGSGKKPDTPAYASSYQHYELYGLIQNIKYRLSASAVSNSSST